MKEAGHNGSKSNGVVTDMDASSMEGNKPILANVSHRKWSAVDL